MKKRIIFISVLALISSLLINFHYSFFQLLMKVRDSTYSDLRFYSNKKAPEHKKWNDLLKKHVSHEGKVDYINFRKDSNLLKEYIQTLSNQYPNDTVWNNQELLCYWINSYNANTILLVIRNLPVSSIKEIGFIFGNPWNIKFIKVGNKTISLEDVEHKILRKKNENRIHFAINCASNSCPMLLNTAYTPDKLEEQLKKQTKLFISDTEKNIISNSEIKLSKIFKWFESDFTKKESVISFINSNSTYEINEDIKISYLKYDWNLNCK